MPAYGATLSIPADTCRSAPDVLPALERPALRFSRNAAVPSRMSSVDATRPNSVASYWHASANGISTPLLTALMM